ncbi:MAG TPA: ABC transporter permease [Thermomicrobiaceae bacterium]|nr:ABC transporter permease [Thermomicrobiaceae bacterium]
MTEGRGLPALVLRYLLLAVAVVLLNFFLPRLMPGDPLDVSTASGLGTGAVLSGPARAELRAYYHLDEPPMAQLRDYLVGLAHGDLGWSIAEGQSVRSLIGERLGWTLALMLSALVVSTLVGTGLGLLAGWRPGTRRDRALVTLAASVGAVPEFLIAIALLAAFALGLGWFPLAGVQSSFADFGGGALGLARQTVDDARHLVLPATALALAGTAGFLLIARDATAGLHRAPWLDLARARGLDERRVALRHALPNLGLPLLTYFGLRLGAVFGGALVVERVFGVPGLGMLAFQAVQARDYPVLQAEFLLASLAVLAANFALELAYRGLERRRMPAHG